MDNLYLFEMLNDHPNNVKMINDTLHDIKNSLYDHLYIAQRALSQFHRVDINFSKCRFLRHNRIVFDIAYTYIENENRCDFRNSKYYKKEVLCDDLFKNPDIFSRAIMVFIDGKLMNNFYVYFAEDRLEIRFARYMKTMGDIDDGMHRLAIDELIKRDTIVSIVFMPICKKATGEIPYKRLAEDNLSISRYADYLMGSSYVDVGDTPMIFMSDSLFGNSGVGIRYNAMMFDRIEDVMTIYDKTYSHATYDLYNPQMYINILYPANIVSVKTVYTNGWFALPIKRTPIPKENILVFKKSATENSSILEFDHTAKIEMYYPNVYRIDSDHTGEYIIYAFYNDDIEHSPLIHYNELNLYMRFMDGLPEYVDGTIPEYIKNYKPIDLEYSIDDYKSTKSEALEYKIQKLREVIYQNPALYSYYLKRYVEAYPNITLEINPEVYNSRLRTDTSIEMPDNPVVTFDSPRFMFSVRRSNNFQLFKFFIDRKAYYPTDDEVFYDGEFMYIYLSTDIVRMESYIEIQKMYDSTFTKSYTVTPGVPIHVSIDKESRAAVEDLYITHNNGIIEEYITDYRIYEKLDNTRDFRMNDTIFSGERYRPIELTSFYKYSDVYIVITDESLDGETITVRSDKRTMIFREFADERKSEINSNVNKDKRNYVIYRDGRLMAPVGVKVRYNEDSNGPHTIQSLIATEEDTVVVASHLPDKYNLVCEYADDYVKRLRIYQRYMDTEEEIDGREGNIYDMQIASSVELENRILDSGHFVDLTNLITKPLDFRWYDIYMNGLKLTERDVTFISPYQMIINLYDDYPDIDTFIIIDMIGFIKKYVIPLPFVNPDWVQVTDAMIDEYPEVMDDNLNVVFDSDTIRTMTGDVLLNPDLADGYIVKGGVE